MKKIAVDKKLTLNKQVVVTLDDHQMNGLKGGARTSRWRPCGTDTKKEQCGVAKPTGTAVKPTTV